MPKAGFESLCGSGEKRNSDITSLREEDGKAFSKAICRERRHENSDKAD